MTVLTVYADTDATLLQQTTDFTEICASLASIGANFERWSADQVLSDNMTQADIISAYQRDINRLMQERGFQSVDVVSLTAEHPDKKAFREKFLNEHIHTEDEVRFFVDGSGLFYIHAGDKVYSILCEKNDLLSVPKGTKHWFDMGAEPFFKCIRLFSRADGWVAEFTGDPIAQRFPEMRNVA